MTDGYQAKSPRVNRFSLAGYQALMACAREGGYRLAPFREFDSFGNESVCLLRHDVDASLNCALKLAECEAQMGLRATYFLMLRSAGYNVLSRMGTHAARSLTAMGHEVALHFDGQHESVSNENLEAQVLQEVARLEDIVGERVGAVSFHQPSRAVLDNDITLPGLLNTYNRHQFAGWYYMSDSNRNWRGNDPWQVLRMGSEKRIQLLTHPMWWVCDLPTTAEVWGAVLLENHLTVTEFFKRTEDGYSFEADAVVDGSMAGGSPANKD